MEFFAGLLYAIPVAIVLWGIILFVGAIIVVIFI